MAPMTESLAKAGPLNHCICSHDLLKLSRMLLRQPHDPGATYDSRCCFTRHFCALRLQFSWRSADTKVAGGQGEIPNFGNAGGSVRSSGRIQYAAHE